MSDKHSPVLVRMENDLKAALLRQSKLHGRTLTGEINNRLRDSLKTTPAPGIAPSSAHLALTLDEAPPYLPTNGTVNVQDLHPTDAVMLNIWRNLPTEKKLALLSLLS